RNNTSSRTFTVTVQVLPPPAPCVTLSPGELWPPNHKMRDIRVTVTVGGNAVCNITNVTSTEPVTGSTYGTFAPDWIFNNQNLDGAPEAAAPGRGAADEVEPTVAPAAELQQRTESRAAERVRRHDLPAPKGDLHQTRAAAGAQRARHFRDMTDLQGR